MSGTMLEIDPVVNPGSAGLPAIDLVTLRKEKLMCADPRTVFWGRARDGFGPTGWETRSHTSSATLVPGATAMPTQITGQNPDTLLDDPVHPPTFDPDIWNAYNQRHAVKFGLAAANGRLKLLNALSVHGDPWGGDFFVSFYGRPGPNGDNAFIWGNNQTAGPSSSGTFLQWAGGGLAFQVNGVLVIPSTLTASTPFTSLFEDGPRLVSVGFSDSTNKARIQIDRGLFDLEVTGITAANSESTFHFGASGAAGSGTIDNGDVGDILVRRGYTFDDPDAIANVNSLIGDFYGVPAL